MATKKCLFILIFLATWQLTAFAQTPPRYFDTAGEPAGIIRLAVSNPLTGTLQDILALKEQGLLPGKFEVVGIYHAKEHPNYKEAQKFVLEQKLDWIHFHEITAEIGPADLYRTNTLSKEYAEIVRKSDGLILFGGPDLPPAAYGDKTELLTVITNPYRHYMELSLVFHLLGGFQDPSFKGLLEGRPDFPVLGICLGEQTLNTGTGGTLIQDVWADLYARKYVEDVIAMGQPNWHTNPWRRIFPLMRELLPYMLHPIQFAPGSKFIVEMGFKAGDQPYIMSAHHQAAGKIGKGFKVAATSLDGKVVEAIEHATYRNVLGVQFHPEFDMLWETEPKHKMTPDDKDLFAVNAYLKTHAPSFEFHQKLWAWFVNKVKKP